MILADFIYLFGEVVVALITTGIVFFAYQWRNAEKRKRKPKNND